EMENLSNPLVVGFYIVSMIVVGSHLWHGVASAFQSLGVDHPRVTPKLLVAGKLLAVLIAGGFIVIAAWVYLTQSGRVHAWRSTRRFPPGRSTASGIGISSR